jgi:hypothetical protein
MAMACFRLVTFFPLRPLRSVPRLRLRMADVTAFRDPLPYRAMGDCPFPLRFRRSGCAGGGLCRIGTLRPSIGPKALEDGWIQVAAAGARRHSGEEPPTLVVTAYAPHARGDLTRQHHTEQTASAVRQEQAGWHTFAAWEDLRVPSR